MGKLKNAQTIDQSLLKENEPFMRKSAKKLCCTIAKSDAKVDKKFWRTLPLSNTLFLNECYFVVTFILMHMLNVSTRESSITLEFAALENHQC